MRFIKNSIGNFGFAPFGLKEGSVDGRLIFIKFVSGKLR